MKTAKQIAIECAKAKPKSYYSEPFEPHEWVLDAMDEYKKQFISEVREAFSHYYRTEGCSCCQDTEGHEEANNKLGELLECEKYSDSSGFDWYKHKEK